MPDSHLSTLNTPSGTTAASAPSATTPPASAMTRRRPVGYLARSKVNPPAATGGLINRARLCASATGAPGKLILLQAPAGYGKTMTMLELRRHFLQAGVLPIWLNLDEGDNDVARFLAGFSLAVAPHSTQLDPDSYQQTRNEELAHRIISSLHELTAPTAIFYDNFEVIRNPAVLGLIARGIEALPAHCRIVIGSRTRPDVGLARLNTRGQLLNIDSAGLRFSAGETREFFHSSGLAQLNNTQLEQLQQSTEGWPAALKLAQIALSGRPDTDSFIAHFSGTNAAVAAFLAEEVLNALPASLQEFLLQSSILDELEPSLCDQVLQRDDSLSQLQELYRRNLFVLATDDATDTFRCHSLFRDFLQTQLQRRAAARTRTLHSRASQIYMQQQRPIPAIRHALKAGAMDAAMPLLLEHADSLLQQGRIGLLTQLMDQVPAASLDQHPHLKLLYAHCLTYTRGPRQGHALIETMQAAQLPADSAAHLAALRPMQLGMMDRIHEAHAQGLAANLNPHTAPHNALVTLSQALTQTSIILGEHEQARQFCDQARYAQGTASDRFNRILAETAEATMELMRGHLKQATQRIRLALNPAANHRLSRRGITMATIQLAETLYEQDQCTEARELLLTNSALVQDMGPPDTLINANVILARIVAHAGDTDHALQLLIELEHSGHRLQLPRVVASARLERARLWLLRGNCSAASEQLALAVKTVDWNSITPLWFSANDTLIPAMVQARLHMQTGEAGRAVSSLRHDLKNAEREQRARRALKLRILLAEALFASGDRNSALRTLTLALNSAAPEGFIRTFIEEGAALAPLLGEIKSLHGHDLSADASGYFRSLEAGFLHPAPARITVSGSDDDQLTGKELEVLKVLALGLSNNAMAEKLFVSESTVRTHLRNINLKLHASNRTEAVSIARQIGLLG